MSDLIQIDELNTAIKNALDQYNEDVVRSLKKTTTRAMKDLVANTKANAPVGQRDKHYRDSITSKTISESRYGIAKLWYVKGSDYRLSHLLNNGHAFRDGSRYPGTNFIGKVVDRLIPWYLDTIEKLLRNGGS